MKQVSEHKQMSVADLEEERVALQREQFNLRMQHATKQLAQTHNLRVVRRKIARVNTLLHAKTGQTS